jgi:hypothetical protein
MPVIALVAMCGWTASASAKPVDIKSDRAALGAYKQFLGALDSRASASRHAAEAYIASISAGCPNVLAPLSSRPSVSLNAIETVGTEGGVDMALAASVPDQPALTSFANRVLPLHWSSRSSEMIVKRYFAVEHALDFMPTSDLCGDARALVASNGQTKPAGTAQALAAISRAGKDETKARAAMTRLLGRFSTKADKPVVRVIKKLAKKVTSEENALVLSEVPKLLRALGIVS